MDDYHSWLDNIAVADMRASKYFVDKVKLLLSKCLHINTLSTR